MKIYCDVALPVPLDQPFTYLLPPALQGSTQPGCRVAVPFGSRERIGVVVATGVPPPEVEAKPVRRLLDEEPVLDAHLLALGAWIAEYYAAPIGEVLRGMLPLASEVRHARRYRITEAGRDEIRQATLAVSGDPREKVLHLLEETSLAEATLKAKVEGFQKIASTLLRKGLIEFEEKQVRKDPLRSPSAKLRVRLSEPGEKLTRNERELVAFLEMHPGSHNLANVERFVPKASAAARSLARQNGVYLEYERGESGDDRGESAALTLLTAYQMTALQAIASGLEALEFRTYLLHGVTGSGKTEVYLQAIDLVLRQGRGALLLVPEIALTPQVAAQFFERFGDKVAILHSAFTDTERSEQWRRIQSGDAPVVVGTRSGVFAPVKNLGLLIVDEEHDSSYKQSETPRYHGRDVAIVRAQALGACVVLGSATPSLESRYNAQRGKYSLLELPDRIGNRPLPRVEIVDMREEFLETRQHTNYSQRLLTLLAQRLESGEQSMLLLNRRGFSNFAVCRACGIRLECQHCSITLTHHRRDRRMLCHLCGYSEKVPTVCRLCESEYIHFMGSGSEKIEGELQALFPEARIARLDRDTVRARRQYENILQEFRDGNYDILVGTQMIAKGHDIQNVTLMGVVSADIGLGIPDFRAAERTFQLLTQAAGRAGRGSAEGLVVIQTINPDHYAIRLAAKHDYSGFYETEIHFRQQMRYPPFSALASILVRHERLDDALRMSGELGLLLSRPVDGVKVLGPAEAPVARMKAEHRYQLLIKASSRKILKTVVDEVIDHARKQEWSPTALVVDIDPINLM